MADTVLVLGATGGIGGEVARQLLAEGWRVRAMHRSPDTARQDGIDWVQGDAMNRDDVLRAAKGAAVIVHAVNPPGYKRWGELVLPMVDNTIAAAIQERATIVLPGTIYNFGPDAFPLVEETSPQRPLTEKGAIRVALEARLEQATEHGARVIIVRAGDFFGPKARNNWFSQGLVKPGKRPARIMNPGTAGVGHGWAYLPDVARTMIELIACRAALDPFACFHMQGHWDDDGRQFAAAIQRVVALHTKQTPTISRFPWWSLAVAAPFSETLRELREMRYLWQTPVRLDNRRLVDTLGHEPCTPLDVALTATLADLQCF